MLFKMERGPLPVRLDVLLAEPRVNAFSLWMMHDGPSWHHPTVGVCVGKATPAADCSVVLVAWETGVP